MILSESIRPKFRLRLLFSGNCTIPTIEYLLKRNKFFKMNILKVGIAVGVLSVS